MMKILAIDTSMHVCSVALSTENLMVMHHHKKPRSHHHCLLPFIDLMINGSGLALTDLDVLAFMDGPGSFTGLRIGIGVIQGLALSANLPILGISTLQAIAETAWQQSQRSPVIVVNDAHMSEVYIGGYQITDTSTFGVPIMQALFDDRLAHIEEVDEIAMRYQNALCVGTGWLSYATSLARIFPEIEQKLIITYPYISAILRLARYQYYLGKQSDSDMALPRYLRSKKAWRKKEYRTTNHG